MKKKKWLLILVAFLIVINLTYYIIINYTNADQIIKKNFLSQLENEFSADIKVDYFSITDKQAHLSDITITDKNNKYNIYIKHIFVEYNLLKFLFSNIRLYHTINNILIYDPIINININNNNKTKQNKSDLDIDLEHIFKSITDFKDKFRNLYVYNGKINVFYADSAITFEHEFDSFNLFIDNSSGTVIDFSLGNKLKKDSQNDELFKETDQQEIYFIEEPDILASEIKAQINLEENNEKFTVKIEDFSPDFLNISNFQNIDFSLNSSFRWSNAGKFLTYQGDIRDFSGSFSLTDFNLDFGSNIVSFNGFDDNIIFESTDLLVFDSNLDFFAELKNFTSDFKHVLHLSGKDLSLEILENFAHNQFYPKGFINFELQSEGTIDKPEIKANIYSSNIKILDEVIEDISFEINYPKSKGYDQSDFLNIVMTSGTWNGIPIELEINYDYFNKTTFYMSLNDFTYKKNNNIFAGNFLLSGNLKKDLTAKLIIDDLSYKNNYISLTDMYLESNIQDSIISASVENTDKTFNLLFNADLLRKDFSAEIDYKNLLITDLVSKKITEKDWFKQIFNPFNSLSGKSLLTLKDDNVQFENNLSVNDPTYSKLNMQLQTILNYDLVEEIFSFDLHSKKGSYRYEPFDISMKILGDKEIIRTKKFRINNDIFGTFEVERKPDITYSVNLYSEKICLEKYLRYFLSYQPKGIVEGEVAFSLSFDSRTDDQIKGSLTGENIHVKKIKPFNISTDFFGNLENLHFENQIYWEKEGSDFHVNTITTEGQISNFFSKPFLLETRSERIFLNDVLDYEHLSSGQMDFVAKIHLTENDFEVSLITEIIDLDIFNEKINRVNIALLQDKNYFSVEKFEIDAGNKYSVKALGKIGYNFFTNQIFESDNTINVALKGDILSIIPQYSNLFEKANSLTEIDLTFGIDNNQLQLNEGFLKISEGSITVRDQPETFKDIRLDIDFINNETIIKIAEVSVGDGKFYVRNEITGEQEDLILGTLKIGQLFARTGGKNILINIPGYLSRQSAGSIKIRGRNNSEARVIGPFEDLKIIADLYISNANIIFPKDTDNWLKLLNVGTETKRIPTRSAIPVFFDIRLIAESQVRYVTYPMYLLLEQGSYFHFTYENGEFIIEESYMSAEIGNINIFNTTFILDFAQMTINDRNEELVLEGIFYKNAFDGSLITLEVSNLEKDRKIRNFNDLQFELKSDNPEDRNILYILAKLRYNRNYDELTQSQQHSLVQDEFLTFAGLGIEKYFTDPIFFTLERKVRQYLKLDYFVIKPGFFSNIIDYYTVENKNIMDQDTEIIEFGRNIILNNLTVNMGKNLSKELFFDYELNVQKSLDIVTSTDLYVYHNFTLELRLPHKLILASKYNLTPSKQRNSFEFFIKRGFRF